MSKEKTSTYRYIILISAAFFVLFLMLSSSIVFKENLFSLLYPKPINYAATENFPDLNDDGKINVFDLGIFANCYWENLQGNTWPQKCDINLDGDVNVFDLGQLAAMYGVSNNITITPSKTASPINKPSVTQNPPLSPTPQALNQ